MAAANIAAVRTPLGIPNDYKPWLTRLGGDKLLMVAFSYGGVPHNKLPKGKPYLERAPSAVALWRSRDSGKTWDKTMRPDTGGWIDVDGFFSQSTTYRARSGKLLHVIRVDATGPHWAVPDLKSTGKENGDQADRMMLWTASDKGARWRRQGRFGTFGAGGEMYPRFLRLPGNPLLLTFTVRSSTTDGNALGLRAIVSPDDGASWDFDHDRLVIDDQNIGASGGGFGNTIRANDGALVSAYSYRGNDGQTHIEVIRWHLPTAKKQ
jgi:hypothetical protein